ncbi:MAG: putative serine/threonine-protein kinase pknB, partial [Myxococcaceae bacterium]|nr:putative serine/threonine-protein kinase pknB [Myxococcaceae bacterium]
MTSEERPTPPLGEADTGQVRVVGGKYRLGRVLGHGGMGVVYEAENTWTGRRVALKVLDPAGAADAVQVGRFMEEARVTAALRHPNIVDVLDMGQDPADGALFIVHELLAGEDLRAMLAREPRLDVDRALDLLAPLLRGLAAAHAAGVVHRDVKPANLFLARSAGGAVVPTLIDFGVARDLGRDDRRQRTGTGETVGTPAYMAPEQLRGDRAVTPAADVWAVGVVLHQMLAGAPPFPADNHHVLVHRVLAGERAPTEVTLAHVPPRLRAVVDRCLDADPARRFLSAAALLDA